MVDERGRRFFAAATVVLAAVVVGALVARQTGRTSPDTQGVASAKSKINSADSSQNAPAGGYPVEISRPQGPPRIATGVLDDFGREITVSCASCHANLEPNPNVSSGEQLNEFHQGLHFRHGQLRCVSCHKEPDYGSLRLADGRAVDYADVQSLCAQCHAQQAKEFDHGAHGGMTGYWDLSRGPRRRKGCIDCHDPHSPAFTHMLPTFKAYDRFLKPAEGTIHD